MPFTQTHRQIRITTPLGADRLLLLSFKGKESLSRLFPVVHAALRGTQSGKGMPCVTIASLNAG